MFIDRLKSSLLYQNVKISNLSTQKNYCRLLVICIEISVRKTKIQYLLQHHTQAKNL